MMEQPDLTGHFMELIRLASTDLRSDVENALHLARDQEEEGSAAELKALGVRVLADTCIVVAPLAEMGIRNVAVDSAKAACYLPSHQGVGLYYGATEELVEAAVRGKWER